MAVERRTWQRDEQLLALKLYLSMPFGRLHKSAPEVVAVAERIGRTPSSVSMKACNFAALDESFTRSGRKGLEGASASDRRVWQEFEANREALVEEMEALAESVAGLSKQEEPTLKRFVGSTETVAMVRQRRGQQFFAAAVRSAYEDRCAITGLGIRSLNVASHIIPWSEDETRRTDPTNGLLLNALIDRAFDRHLVTFDEGRRLVCGKALRVPEAGASMILSLEGTRLRVPEKFQPAEDALRHHRARFAANENC